jgi:hypothetical protein
LIERRGAPYGAGALGIKRDCLRFWAIFGALCTPAVCRAQVDIEPLRAKLPDDGVGGRLDARANGRRGNVDGLTAGGQVLLGARSEPHLGFIGASGDYAEFSDEVKVERYFAHVRYAHTLASWLWGEAFAQLEANRFAALAQRRLLGSGPRFQLLKFEEFRAYFSTAYMLEHERLDLPASAPDDRETLSHRWSNTLAVLLQADERIVLSATLLFQPRFDQLSDHRLLSVTGADFEVTELVTTSIGVAVRYDSEPPTGVKATDYEINNQIGLRF